MRAIIDSDVLIDFLQGNSQARTELGKYRRREISVISWMEILAGAETPAEEAAAREFLTTFTVHELSPAVAEEAVTLRKTHRLRLPDAVIWATARTHGCLLVTRNTKDFSAREPGIRIPYTLA